MRLISYGNDGTRVGLLGDDTDVHDVVLDDRVWAGDLGGLLLACSGDSGRLRSSDAVVARLSDIVLSAPSPRPSKVIAAPVNYRDHMTEMNEASSIDALGLFLKAPSSLVGEGATVRLPYHDRRFDQEGELALVIGRTARDASVESAGSHVFGYSCLLDITMRGGEDRSTRKSFDSFTPMGPWLVTADEVGDLDDLQLVCSVNGQVRQDADVRDLLWNVPALVSYASSVMTLLPGDVISTGTPAGVGRICGGDSVSVTITRVGTLSVVVDDVGARICPTSGAGRGPVPPAEQTPVRVRAQRLG